MLLGDVGHIGEYNGEGNGKHSRYRDNGKVPPKTQQDFEVHVIQDVHLCYKIKNKSGISMKLIFRLSEMICIDY